MSTTYAITPPFSGGLAVGQALVWGSDLTVQRLAAASLLIGAAPSASPLGNSLTIGEASRPGTDANIAGGNATISSGLGTGNAAGSQVIIRTPTTVGAGSGAQTLATRLTIDATAVAIAGNATVGGTLVVSAGQSSITPTMTVASGAGAVLDALAVPATTITLSGSTNITTAAGFNFVSIKQPTLSAALALTITTAATLTVLGAPIAGGAGPAALTNALAFWVQAGTTRLDGDISLSGSKGAAGQVLASGGAGVAGTWKTALVTLADTRATAQTGAVASVATFTVGGSDSSFLVSSNVNVTTSTTFSITVTVTYTDETNTSRVLTLSFTTLAGVALNAATNVQGAGPYEGIPVQIRCKASTSITIATTGSFTAVVYNVEGTIIQIA